MVGSPMIIAWPNSDGSFTISQRQATQQAMPTGESGDSIFDLPPDRGTRLFSPVHSSLPLLLALLLAFSCPFAIGVATEPFSATSYPAYPAYSSPICWCLAQYQLSLYVSEDYSATTRSHPLSRVQPRSQSHSRHILFIQELLRGRHHLHPPLQLVRHEHHLPHLGLRYHQPQIELCECYSPAASRLGGCSARAACSDHERLYLGYRR